MRYEEEVNALIKKTDRSLEAAKDLFNKGYYDFSVSRAYYTMFYCAEALLLTKDLTFSKHSAVISFFGREFIKTGILPEKFYTYIANAFKERQRGDYEAILYPEREECEIILEQSEEFLRAAKELAKNDREMR